MTLLSEYVDKVDLGGGTFRNVINMRPIAVRQSGVLLAMNQDFADGDATWGHTVLRAPLRVRRANDGGGRMYPVPGDDDKWLYLGPPKVQVGGVWTAISLGTPSRVGKTLTWTRAQSVTTFTHGGHFADLQIELLGGFVPENNLIAFPVEINGLTRSGLNILDGGRTVARLRPFVMYDAANLNDRRAITQAFVNIGGAPHVRLTLPSLTGMVRPVIDPTVEIQPDGTAGVDTQMFADTATTNYGTDTSLAIGEGDNGTNYIWRTLIKFDLSSIPAASIVSSATASLYATYDGATEAGSARWYRQKRAWVEAQATWNIYSTGNSWQTAGGFGSDDCEQTDIGLRAFTASETLNQFKDWSLTASAVQEWISGAFANNGMLGKMVTELNDQYSFASSDNATAANRPKLTVAYTEASTATPFFVMSRRGVGIPLLGVAR